MTSPGSTDYANSGVICARCGAVGEPGAAFCARCDAALSSSEQSQGPQFSQPPNRSFVKRHPLVLAVVIGHVAFIAGSFIGIGVLIGPIIAGYVFAKNVSNPRTRRRNIWLQGALPGALLPLSASLVVFLIAVVVFAGFRSAWVVVPFATIVVVTTVVAAGLGGFGAWIAERTSKSSQGPAKKETEPWERIETADPWASGEQQR